VSGPSAVVVIPARDEEQRIGACLRALGAQEGLAAGAFAVILVLDRTTDATARCARDAAGEAGLELTIVDAAASGVGAARRTGMDVACARLEAGGGDGLIACTDADTEVDPHWLATQLLLVDEGADAIGGRIDLDPREAAALPPRAVAWRAARARDRFAAVRAEDPRAEHHFFSGASMALTARAYRACGGIPPSPVLEDEALAKRLIDGRLRIVRSDAVRVRTSARTDGRAARGLAHDLRRAASALQL
jgi:glycosyltransferase involved in cell wall biosynthesis